MAAGIYLGQINAAERLLRCHRVHYPSSRTRISLENQSINSNTEMLLFYTPVARIFAVNASNLGFPLAEKVTQRMHTLLKLVLYIVYDYKQQGNQNFRFFPSFFLRESLFACFALRAPLVEIFAGFLLASLVSILLSLSCSTLVSLSSSMKSPTFPLLAASNCAAANLESR